MPARAKSLRITDRYRNEMIRLRQQGQREAKRIWRGVDSANLDATFNIGLLELTVATLQREAARLSSAYLAAFVASELAEPQQPPALTVWDKTFNGNPLKEGLRSAVIKAKMAIKDGQDPTQATNASRDILVSDVGLFIDTAARESLRQGMEMDDRIVGYQRAVKGTCGACSGDTQYEAFSENAPVVPLNVHPNAVLEGSTFASYGELQQMIAARYSGPAVRLRTVGGHDLTIGPNHPMLTGRGWVVASELHQGDELVYDLRHDASGSHLPTPLSGAESNLQKVVSVEDSFETLRSAFDYATVAGAGYDFHGDRDFCVGEVEVVRPERRLLVEWDLGFAEQVRQSVLVGADAELAGVASLSPRNANGQRVLLTASGSVGGSGSGSAHYSLQSIEAVDFVWFDGWAFDASAETSLYCSNGFVVANCQCVAEPVMSRSAPDKTKRQGDLGSWDKAYNDAVKGIDRVHTYPKDTVISPVYIDPKLRTSQAAFDALRREIRLNPKASPDAKTLLHELGHKLDEAMATTRLNYASMEARKAGTPAMKELVSAFRKSEAYKRIGEAPELAGQTAYWRSSNEMFARAYAQYVAKKGRVPGATKWEDWEIKSGVQWEAKDFKEISKAMENLLREQGLLK